MIDWMIYSKIQEAKRRGFNKTQTARWLNLNRETVRTYWDMPPDKFAKRLEAAQHRESKVDKYKEFVVSCLTDYPDMSAAQIYDWIKERNGLETLDFQKRAFRDYVRRIREEYDIKKPVHSRQYEAVDELPPGQQAQVDMGEIYVETTSGRNKKIYCFAMVLAHSRYKYVLWQEHPFTTDTFITAHVKAFAFLEGRPKEIVYDQDKILAVSENYGDIIYTDGFQSYLSEVGFEVRLCRGHDPESKGKVENVVKYAKHGFAEHRIFSDIESFNEDCIRWLARTGNAEEHGTTHKIPAEVFALEKEYLIPVSEYSFEAAINESVTYQVRKDNIVLYKGNRYRVPKGTYSPGKKVLMIVDDEEIVSITDAVTMEVYARYPVCYDKGKLIGTKHDREGQNDSLKEVEDALNELFNNDELVGPFLEHLHQQRSRYYRDQLYVIKKLFEEWNAEAVIKGLHYCSERKLYSAGDLKSSIIYLSQEDISARKTKYTEAKLPEKYQNTSPEIRNLQEYEAAMDKEVFANG